MNKLDERRKSKYDKFREKMQNDPNEFYHILYEKFAEVENLKNRIRYLEDVIRININSKRLIQPCNNFQITSREDSIYIPKKLKNVVETVGIFEEQKN